MFGKNAEPSQLRILLVEDDPFQQKLIAKRLERESFLVTTVSNSGDALKEIQSTKFAVAIVDLGLPDSNGLELVRILNLESKQTIVIVYSADSSFESAKESLNLGVLGYVGKSEDLRVLIERVHFAATKYLNDVLTKAEGEIRFHLRVLDIVEDGVVATNLNCELIYWNRFASEHLNIPKQIKYGFSGLNLFCIRKSCRAISDSLARMRKGNSISGQVRLRRLRSDSDPTDCMTSRVAVRYRASPILDQSKGIIGYVFSFSDITQERRNQAAIQAFADQQATLAEIGRIAQSSNNIDEFLHDIAPSIQQTMRVDEVFFERELSPSSAPSLHAQTQASQNLTDKVSENTYRSKLNPDKTYYRIAIKRNNQKPPSTFLVICSRNERIYSESEKIFLTSVSKLLSNTIERFYAASRWKSLFENSLNAIILLDDQGEVVDANDAASKLLEYDRVSLYGLHFSVILRTNESDEFATLWAKLREQKTITGDHQLLTKIGRLRETKYVAVANIVEGLHMFDFRDVTEERILEEKLQQDRDMIAHFQRNAAIGQMAAVLAHEINQPLGAISNYIGGLLFDIPKFDLKPSDSPTRTSSDSSHAAVPVEKAHGNSYVYENVGKSDQRSRFTEFGETLQEVQRQALRAGDIVRRLRRYVSTMPTETKPFCLNELILDTLTLLQSDFRTRQIEAITNLDNRIPLMHGDAVQIQQVVVNLLKNAVDALSEKRSSTGKVVVSTRRKNNDVILKVADNGHGAQEKDFSKLFEPYYTTRIDGLGLGLSISQSIVQRHNGTITVAKASLGGLEFTVQFPELLPDTYQ